MDGSIYTSSWREAPVRSSALASGTKRSAEMAGLAERSFLDYAARRPRPKMPRPAAGTGVADADTDGLTQEERETRLGVLVGTLSDRQCRRLVLQHALGHPPLMEDIEDALEAWGEDDEDEDDDFSPDTDQWQQQTPPSRPRRPSRPGFPSQDPRYSPTTPRRRANRLLYTDRQIMVSRDPVLAEKPALDFDLFVERLELKVYAYRHRQGQGTEFGEKKRVAIDRHWTREIIDMCNTNLRTIRENLVNDTVSPASLINACQAVLEMTLVLFGTPGPIEGLVEGRYKYSGSKWVHYWPDLSFEEYWSLLSSDETDIFLSKLLWRTGRTVNQELSDLVRRCNMESMMPGFGESVATLLPVPLDQRPGASPLPTREPAVASFKEVTASISRDYDRERRVLGDRAPLVHAIPVAFRMTQTVLRICFAARPGSSFATREHALVALCDLISIVLRDPLTRFADEIRRHFAAEGGRLIETFRDIADGLTNGERSAVLEQSYAALRPTVEQPTVEDALEEYAGDAKFHGLFPGLDECLAVLRSKESPAEEKPAGKPSEPERRESQSGK